MNYLVRLAVTALAAAASSLPAAAQEFPSRPIRAVVPYAPGGNVDISIRTIGPSLTEILGQQIVVDNRPGGGGNVGAALVAKAPADGHTLLIGSSGPLSINPVVHQEMPYDSIRDFAPVSRVQSVPLVVLANQKFPVTSVKDLVERARAQPGKITVASAGTGTTNHFAIELFSSLAGVQVLHVPYKGSGPALTELLGGQVNVMFDQLSSSMGFIKEGRIRVIAVTTAKRIKALPDVPTLAESGIAGYEASTFLGILAPAQTPSNVVMKLNAAIRKTMETPAVQERFRNLGADPGASTPAEFGKIIKDELEKWRRVAKSANLQFN